MKRAATIILAAAALVMAHGASALWSLGTSGSGVVSGKTMGGAVNAPTGSVSSHDVSLTWTGAQFTDGTNVPAYVVKRYDAVTNALQVVLSGCAGLVGGPACIEHAVPTGTWKYTITPAAGTKWRGTESAQSSVVVILL